MINTPGRVGDTALDAQQEGPLERAINRVGDTAEVMVGRAQDKVVLVTRRLAVRVARSPTGRRGGVSFRLSAATSGGRRQ